MKKLVSITISANFEVDDQELVDAQQADFEDLKDAGDEMLHDYVIDHSGEVLEAILEGDYDVISVEISEAAP